MDPRVSPSELKAQIELERDGAPFLVHRALDGAQVITTLQAGAGRVLIGRTDEAPVSLPWDDQVSRVHAEINHVGPDWTIADDGLSTNGTFVNGERVQGRRRLRNGDRIQVGETVIVFRAPDPDDAGTVRSPGSRPAPISPAQRRVLIALCRPYRDGLAFATPPTNQQIAAELFISGDSVKTHMRALFERFEVEDLAPNQKRARLAELAFRSGEVTPRDLEDPTG